MAQADRSSLHWQLQLGMALRVLHRPTARRPPLINKGLQFNSRAAAKPARDFAMG